MTTNEGSQLSASPVNIPAKIQTNEHSNPPSLASDSLPDLEEQIKEVILGPDPKKKATGDKKRFGTAWRKDVIRQQQRDLQNLTTNSKTKKIETKTKSTKTGQRRNSTKSSSIQESNPRTKLKNKKSNIGPQVKIIMSEQDVENDNEEDDDNVIPHVPFMDDIVCPFSCKIIDPFTEFIKLNEHLKQEHNITFLHLDHMHSVLQEYLNEWADRIKSENVENVEDVSNTESDGTKSYTINPKTCPEDLKLRKSLQQIKLKEILEIQEKERHHDNLQSRKCLFCQVTCENRAVLFRHMFVDHNFNIGLHDNLVQVSQFLDILDAKLESLQCIYCEKHFTNSTVLRKHMRKKKHFKINARNQLYDKFYVINYLEPGKNWESFENEKYDSDEDKRDDSWAEWDEVESEPTKCLFDDKIFDGPNEALQYMANTYKFVLDEVCQKNELDFYKSIALINYIRFQTSNLKCITCDFTAPDSNQLSQHYLENSCLQTIPPSDHQLWKDPQYLLPVLENDGLLTFLDDYTDEEEEISQQKMYEAIYTSQSNNSDTSPNAFTPSNEAA